MDEKFVQGVVGGVLNRHKDRTLDKDRIQTLMVEIAANIDLVSANKIELSKNSITDNSGNPLVDGNESENYQVDTKAPTVSVDINDTLFTSGELGTVTVTFSNKVAFDENRWTN